jgi:four helix bundle protein
MKKKRERRTLNVEHPTSNTEPMKRTLNIEWNGSSVRSSKDRMKRKTPNAQHRTSNVEVSNGANRNHIQELSDREYGRRADYDLEDRLLEFAAQIVELVELLPSSKAGNHIAGQLLRCGTSPLSNHGEVEAAESRKDFLHKLRICLKELRETKRWLRLVGRLKLVQGSDLGASLAETEELIRIFVASARTTQKNAK